MEVECVYVAPLYGSLPSKSPQGGTGRRDRQTVSRPTVALGECPKNCLFDGQTSNNKISNTPARRPNNQSNFI